ncbi:TPA: hypothetical protein QDB51_003429 [Burkholderia vietnamiensis]|nr:hypothetical protein [Burkholderia vietnamiensis]
MTKKTTTIKTLALASLLCVSSIAWADDPGSAGSGTADATTSTGASTSLVLPPPQYSDDQLAQAGCDKNVWTKMVADYNKNAQTKAAIGENAALRVKNLTPSASNVASCFDSAAQLVNNATRAYNTIASLLTGGGLDPSNLYSYAQKLVVGAACSQVNQMVNSSGLGSTIGQANSAIGGALNTGTTIGGINTGSVSTILNGGGYQQNTSNNIPYVNGTGLANSTGATGILNNLNPFK